MNPIPPIGKRCFNFAPATNIIINPTNITTAVILKLFSKIINPAYNTGIIINLNGVSILPIVLPFFSIQ